jgi:hypothetical protein
MGPGADLGFFASSNDNLACAEGSLRQAKDQAAFLVEEPLAAVVMPTP